MAKVTKKYSPKKLINGSVIGRTGQYVALPDIYKNCITEISYQGETMTVTDWLRAESYRRFPDKFGRGKMYTLAYFKWKGGE